MLGLGAAQAPAGAQEAQHRIEGVLTNADGEALGDQQIGLFGQEASQGQNARGVTAADGTFAFEVADGTYNLHVSTPHGSECMVAGYDNPSSGRKVVVSVSGQAISGIEVTISGTPGARAVAFSCFFPDETLGHIRGTVTDGEGQPVGDLWVAASVYGNSGAVNEVVLTASDGSFHLRLRHGVYWLYVHSDRTSDCTVSGYEDATPGGAIFDTRDGDVAGLQLTISGVGSGDFEWAACQFDTPFSRIEGTVLGPEGEPVDGINVRAFGELGEPSFGPWVGSTNSSGAYAIEVPDGSYVVESYVVLSEGECRLGYGNLEGGHTFSSPKNRRIAIVGEDVAGVDTRLPATVSELCRPIRGHVTDSDGNPLRVSLAADGLGPLVGARVNWASATDGAFTLYGSAGSYNLGVTTTAGSACTVVDRPDGRPGRRATIEVGSEGTSGVRIVISGDPSDSRQRLNCLFPPEMVTTELQPGWNLAGWTGGEVRVESLFRAIPELEAAYSWDEEVQSFSLALNLGQSIRGGLTTLQPGTGLWLHVGGEEPVMWTRAFLPQAGLVSLAEGWNLVSWGGEDGATVDEALAALGAELKAAVSWDTVAGQSRQYAPTAPATDSRLQQLSRGDAMWLEMSAARHWLQPGSAQSPITYAADVSETTRSSFPATVEAVLTYFAERYGVFVPTSFRVDTSGQYCGFYQGRTVNVREDCLRSVAHEYTHAIQAHLYTGSGANSAWIREGMANRWSTLYYDSTGDSPYEEHIKDITLPGARLTPIPLQEMDGDLFIEEYATPNYSVAHLAIDWMVALAGEDRTLDYYSNRSSYDTWQEAFDGTFGIGVDDFYESFAAHRADVAPLRLAQRIAGTVVGPDDQPLAGVRVFGEPEGTDGTVWSTTSGEDGTFEVAIANGAYLLSLTDFSLTEDCHFGWYDGDDSLASRRSQALAVTVDGADIGGIQIRLAADPATLASELCSRVEGVILGPEGEPVAGVYVLLLRHDDRLSEGTPTGTEGQFLVVVPSGFYWVSLHQGACHLGWYGGGGRLATPGRELLLNVKVGTDFTGIEVRLPASVSDLCQ